MEPLLSGEFTLKDQWLYEYMRALWDTENIFIEPSSCAAFEGPLKLTRYDETRKYIKEHGLEDKMEQSAHIAWATGGSWFRKISVKSIRIHIWTRIEGRRRKDGIQSF